MKKLFRGTFRGIPVAILVVALLLTAGAGAVLAAGYVLTTVDVTMTVPEPITVYYDETEGGKEKTMGLNGRVIETAIITPGFCWGEWLLFESATTYDLLLKASVQISEPSEGVSVEFWDNGEEVDLEGVGVTVNSTAPVAVRWKICVAGDAVPDTYTISVSFTRESPPANGDE